MGEAVLLAALLALAVVIAATGHRLYRLLALVPAATALGLLLYVVAGGVIILATWLGAAAAARLDPRLAAA